MKKRKSEKNEDGLSDLPDCVLIQLMSFMPSKDAVQTCILSRRWKDLWKRVPTLILHSSYSRVRQITAFNNFVLKVLSLRDDSVPLYYLDLYHIGRVPPDLLERVLTYSVSHNVEQLKLYANCDSDLPLPPCLFSCQTLKSLDLSIAIGCPAVLLPRSLNLTALTSLRLHRVYLGDSSPFLSCVNLKTLVIDHCRIWNSCILCISNATLVNLSIRASPFLSDSYKVVLSTPNLRSFAYSGIPCKQIFAGNLSHIKEVNIEVHESQRGAFYSHYLQSAHILISWLQVFANVRSLTLCSNTLQLLFSIPDLLNTEDPCFGKLKSLVVKVKNHLVPDGIVDYLVRNSPFAEITIINC